MKLRFECREENCPALIEYRPKGEPTERLNCPRCQREYAISHADTLLSGQPLSRCAMCGGEEFFVRKNFPQKTGLVIVVLAGLVSFWTLTTNPLLSYGILALAVLVDLVIYYLIGIVTVCYRCRTEYWGVPRNSNHDWFDLATSEKYL